MQCLHSIPRAIVALLLVSSASHCLAGTHSLFFYFVRSWSPSFCKLDYSADRGGACQTASNRFTIHGLWLTCSNGAWPDEARCSGSPYNASAVSQLVPTLDDQWPSYGDKGNKAFWEHEWTCHGVCANVADEALTSQAAFFQRVLQLDRLKTLNVLTQRLQLDSEVKTSDLLEQATQLLGAVPILTCYYRGNTAYLNSIMTCLRNDLSLEDCGDSYESCDTETLTVPSWNPAINEADDSKQVHYLQRSLLKSDSRGCAVSQQKCILPG